MVANHGYLPDRVNFAARIAKNRVNPEVPVDLIASFKAAAESDPGHSLVCTMCEAVQLFVLPGYDEKRVRECCSNMSKEFEVILRGVSIACSSFG